MIVENLVKHFATSFGVVKAVEGVSFQVKRGEVFGLVGESGSGKSTVGFMAIGVYEPTSGKIEFNGKDISMLVRKRSRELKKEMQIVFQDPGSSLNPTKTVRDIVALPLKTYRICKSKDEVYARVEELLDAVELDPQDFMLRRPRDIGGGERQAVAIARAIAAQPSFVVLDEPTSALDVSIQAKILTVLTKLQRRLNMSYLFITHDLSLMRNVSSKVAIMYLGKILEHAPTAVFFQNPLHPYTQMLLSSAPVLSPEEEAMKPKQVKSTGEIPSSINPPPGCSFHTRCPFVMDICKTKEPKLGPAEAEHYVACWLHMK